MARIETCILTRAGEEESWTVNISNAPGVKDFEVYHPRWSNDVRYMVMTGPYTTGDEEDQALGRGGRSGNLHREVRQGLRSIDGWLKLTNSRVGEFFPDVWIAGGEHEIEQV